MDGIFVSPWTAFANVLKEMPGEATLPEPVLPAKWMPAFNAHERVAKRNIL